MPWIGTWTGGIGPFFAKSNVSVFLNDGSLWVSTNYLNDGVIDGVHLLDITGDASVCIARGAIPKKVVIHDEAALDTCQREVSSLFSTVYYPIGNEIYLAASVSELPNYFFGDLMDPDVDEIKVYYEGTEAEWDRLTVGSVGNLNYTFGNVSVIYNYDMENEEN